MIITIQDNIHGQIQVTTLEKEIINSIPFNRLHDVYQDSLSFLTFPTNRTKRFEHSLGVMKICGDMVLAALRNSDPTIVRQILTGMEKSVKTIVLEVNRDPRWEEVLQHKEIRVETLVKNHLDRSTLRGMLSASMDVNDEELFYASLMLETVRCAAMLHDIGHPPFSHVVEKAMPDVYKELAKGEMVIEPDNERVKDFKRAMSICSLDEEETDRKERKPHEAMGDHITEQLLTSIILNHSGRHEDASWRTEERI